jgi:hypothetical protein
MASLLPIVPGPRAQFLMETLARRERELADREAPPGVLLAAVRGVSNETGLTGLTMKSDILPAPGADARPRARP